MKSRVQMVSYDLGMVLFFDFHLHELVSKIWSLVVGHGYCPRGFESHKWELLMFSDPLYTNRIWTYSSELWTTTQKAHPY